MLYRIEVEIEVPEAGKCPVHKDTVEKQVGAATRKVIKGLHQCGAKLLLVDAHILDEEV